jgi:hypothetical protein
MYNDFVMMGIGFVIGAFCPSVLRSIKAWFVAKGNAAKTDLAKKIQPKK